jgi:hypothetical protein
MPTEQDQGLSSESISGESVSRRDLLKGAMAGAGALVLNQTGLVAAQPLTPTPTATPTAATSATGLVARGQPVAPEATSSQTAYAVPSARGVVIKPVMTVGDQAANGYKMVGIPDGLGGIRTGGTFTLVMNHELGAGTGAVRAHGSKGAFVSQWVIDRNTLEAVSGKDFVQAPSNVHLFSGGAYTTGTTEWRRFCSGDLASPTAFRHGSLGTPERIYLNGEEVADGRGFAHIVTGPEAGHSWQIPRFGRLAYENAVASPHGKMKTVVMLMDDGDLSTSPTGANPSEVFVYIGTKQQAGTTIERAGLTNGKLYGIRVYREQTLVTEESEQFGLGDATTGYVDQGSFMLVELGDEGDVSGLSAQQMEQDAIAHDIFRMQRPEDGAWDPRSNRRRDYFFVTTASITQTSRLWHLRFNDVNLPENGGRIEILLNATPGRMFDNITIDELGRLLLQEDTGNQPHVAKVWIYGIDTGELIEVAHHDPARFEPGGGTFITQDEESSGIIDAADLIGPGWFLFDVQVHKANADPALVEEGQLLAMYVPMHIGLNRGRRGVTDMNSDD